MIASELSMRRSWLVSVGLLFVVNVVALQLMSKGPSI